MFQTIALKIVYFGLVNPLLWFSGIFSQEEKTSSFDLSEEEQKQIIEEFKFNKEVFEKIYNAYFEIIFRFLLKRSMSSEIAYDILADTFEKAFLNFDKFKWQGYSVKVWLFRIAINRLKNYRRSKLNKEIRPLSEVPEGMEGMYTDVKDELKFLDEALFNDNELSKLSDAIETLSPRHKEIVSLYYFSDMSQKEISLSINKSESAVKASMHRAMENLRSILNPNLL
ncbi:MAG: RNA polymerase sigma factor [Candidatus Gracilibacteria bacterium]|jgi:RNA polymerase sigma-70 factor (ECF subfamily)|nr:RNA polymerase sigma factor [Candidatus Gracilibacteria bacterium]